MATPSVHRDIPLRKRPWTSRLAVQLPLGATETDVRRPPAWPELPEAARARALGALAQLLATAALNDAAERDDRD